MAKKLDFIETEVKEIFKKIVNGPISRSIIVDKLRKRKSIQAVQAGMALAYINDRVRRILNKLKPSIAELAGTTTHQLELPNILQDCVRLQSGYWIGRDGESKFVPTLQLSVDETREIAKHHRRMGDGCHLHADELDRLADWRDEQGKTTE